MVAIVPDRSGMIVKPKAVERLTPNIVLDNTATVYGSVNGFLRKFCMTTLSMASLVATTIAPSALGI